MLPALSTVTGEITLRFAFRPPPGVANAWSRVPTPVSVFTRQTDPPLPGTYSEPFASAGWKTPSQFVKREPTAFQSLSNRQASSSAVCR
jgi:hypothetical protein